MAVENIVSAHQPQPKHIKLPKRRIPPASKVGIPFELGNIVIECIKTLWYSVFNQNLKCLQAQLIALKDLTIFQVLGLILRENEFLLVARASLDQV